MLTKEIIETFELLGDAERGQAYSAIYNYIYGGAEVDAGAPCQVQIAFRYARSVVDPILARQERIQARRRGASLPVSADGSAASAAATSPERTPAEASPADVCGEGEAMGSAVAAPSPEAPPAGGESSADGDEKSPEKGSGPYYSSYVKQAYTQSCSERTRRLLILRELRRRHPGFMDFSYDASGNYSIVG